jgi:hypothetical protein
MIKQYVIWLMSSEIIYLSKLSPYIAATIAVTFEASSGVNSLIFSFKHVCTALINNVCKQIYF